MGFSDMFKDKSVMIKVVDSIASEADYSYWVEGKIAEETDNFIVIRNAIIGYENYTIDEAKEVIINKGFVTNIKESKGNEVDMEILRRYRKNRLDWVVGAIFFLFGMGMGLIATSVYLYFLG